MVTANGGAAGSTYFPSSRPGAAHGAATGSLTGFSLRTGQGAAGGNQGNSAGSYTGTPGSNGGYAAGFIVLSPGQGLRLCVGVGGVGGIASDTCAGAPGAVGFAVVFEGSSGRDS